MEEAARVEARSHSLSGQVLPIRRHPRRLQSHLYLEVLRRFSHALLLRQRTIFPESILEFHIRESPKIHLYHFLHALLQFYQNLD